ncbi:HlyU family transcriptional regulator [Celeribacter sp. SCSIO 80788]|uniref:HlyU family transcriptional regulator n=1 Tax=Celeribacter sp. SCSIO 80788 TaxID=3117013 RepID=UPI003DA3153B
MSLFGKLFGGKSGGKSQPDAAPQSTAKPELYGKDYRIFPEPMKAESGYRIAARIEKDIDGETRAHMMIRADTMSDLDDARQESLRKAQIFIDQMGDSIFDDPRM